MNDNTADVPNKTVEENTAEIVAEPVRSIELLKAYNDAHEELSAIPTSNRKGLEAASARLHAAAEAMITTPAGTIEDLAAKVAFLAAEHEAENDSSVLRGLNSLRADLTRMCA